MLKIRCGARDSLLSRAQVAEIQELCSTRSIVLDPVWIQTTGDLDRTTSLRGLGKTNFFSQQLDEMLLSCHIRMAIHSAKDLPDPLPKGIVIAALTKGQDPRDSLVFFKPLFSNPCIATSSERREACVRLLYPQATFVDIRGTIEKRLQVIERGEADGVVIAEAALIRLRWTHLQRIFLPGDVALGQGRLAITVREDDEEMRHLFTFIHDPILALL